MICHGIGILPLIPVLESEFPAAKQQWFADDGFTAGKFVDIRAQFERLLQLGPNDGYFPESSKTILVVAPHNVEQEFAGLNFQAETSSYYLGSFIGEATERDSWIANKVDDWVYSIESLQVEHVLTLLSPALSTTRMAVSTTHCAKHGIML